MAATIEAKTWERESEVGESTGRESG